MKEQHRPLEKFEFTWHEIAHPDYEEIDEPFTYYGQPHDEEEYHYMPEDYHRHQEEKTAPTKQQP